MVVARVNFLTRDDRLPTDDPPSPPPPMHTESVARSIRGMQLLSLLQQGNKLEAFSGGNPDRELPRYAAYVAVETNPTPTSLHEADEECPCLQPCEMLPKANAVAAAEHD